jgi:hypothetical protein
LSLVNRRQSIVIRARLSVSDDAGAANNANDANDANAEGPMTIVD